MKLAILWVLVLTTTLAISFSGCSSTKPHDADTVISADQPTEKIVIKSLTDLPAHTYAVSGSVTDLLADDSAFVDFAALVRQDIEADLAKYQIDDAATLQDMYNTLSTLEQLSHDYHSSLMYLDKSRELEDKEAARLTNGLVTRSRIVVMKALGSELVDEKFRTAFRKELQSRVSALPWDVIQDVIEGANGRAQIISENFLLGIVQANFDPVVEKKGELSGDLARGVLGIKLAIDQVLTLNSDITAVYSEFIASHTEVKQDIWAARDVEFSDDENLTSTVIGIWDSGTDMPIFGQQAFVNSGEMFDGTDTDGNGFVDDVNGIAYDVYGVPHPELLHPVGDQEGRVEAIKQYMKGFMDLQSAIDSDEASALRKHLGSLPPQEVGDFLTGLSFYGLYAHGTHVAGIAAAGNPFAKLLGARITFDYHNPPLAMSLEIARNHAASYAQTVKYFTERNVRVVNMSWGWTFKEIESSLEANGIGSTVEERSEMAREMFDIIDAGLKKALASSPDILYVVAAGNDDNDVEFDLVIPSNYDLPNVLVVGAVDQAGDPTGFTSGGRTVVVYANGFEVESYVPGGGRMPMSGTSMSSPNVCNLAAKIFTIDPTLKPHQVVDVIKRGADANPKHAEIMLINPVQSVKLARAEK